ncbi:hypothetical protein ASG40_12935 [Methylobacterium sp. Leaf399]|uniref:DUF5681 domain-containing protein n=1 Tax=unclassified Methylobacterium TaxID=2615210 RepID=UPI0006F54269|nr:MULTISPECIES: DUF5681 domain-containing protein [unclassified Methylobacterium]KQP50825.1 hypothetical protein ASF39_11315 [Methylobacterium sp. Leaf108]KQT07806.1 hypothetical protein ASG40_12935 [Methylobacterium sp. Leaf399]KQT88921.1 hypothetical protein ASG59_13705 [Methylobacterium sp. Leaf466]
MPFQPGQSGNPGGRPKASARVRDAAREHTEAALQVLIDIAVGGTSEAARVSAASAILDRGYGKPSQPVDGDGEGGEIPVGLTVKFIRPPAIP